MDRTKVLETAQKHLARSNYDRAIAEYRKLVQEDPRDVRTWLKIGDIYTRKGETGPACDTYLRVAGHYADQGFFLKAVAVYKRILQLDPSRLEVSIRLAEMYEQLQLSSDALETYEQVAAAHGRNGNVDAALQVLAKMADLDEDNIPVRIKYAEALSKAGKTSAAADEFERGANLLREQGRIDDYMKVAERLLYHRSENTPLARELAKLYIERNDPKRALSKLQLCFKSNPRDVDTLELLAEAFQLLGQTPKTISVYREVARIHEEVARTEDQVRIYSKILELDPADKEALDFLQRHGAAARLEQAPEPIHEESQDLIIIDAEPGEFEDVDEEPQLEIVEDDDLVLLDEDDSEVHPSPVRAPAEESPGADRFVALGRQYADDHRPIPPQPVETEVAQSPPRLAQPPAAQPSAAQPSAAQPPVPEPDVPSAEQSDNRRPSARPSEPPKEAQIARLLNECDVFKRYGLMNKVVDHLERILELDPDHIPARERLKDAYIELGQPEDAVRQLRALAELFRASRPTLFDLYVRQAHELESDEIESGEFESDELGPDEIELTAREAVSESAIPSLHPLDDEDEVMFVDGDEDTEGDEDILFIASEPPEETSATEEQIASTDELQFAGEPEVEIETEALDASDDGLAPFSPEEFDAAPLSGMPAEDEAQERVAAPAGDVEESLEEAEFFIAQGLWEAARSTLEDALEAHPGHPLLTEQLEEVHAASQESTETSPAEEEDESFALAEKLAEALGPETLDDTASDMLDVESVFAQFKKGIEEQIDAGDSDTHFDLGIAYKEMGLIDDAVREFELSMSRADRECMAHTMIGMCYIEQNKVPEGISHFKKGLYAESKTDREELGLYFELGQAYEMLRDPEEALYYYQKVQKRDANFRNIQHKLQSLMEAGGSLGRAGNPEIKDVDQAFDDLFRDDG